MTEKNLITEIGLGKGGAYTFEVIEMDLIYISFNDPKGIKAPDQT